MPNDMAFFVVVEKAMLFPSSSFQNCYLKWAVALGNLEDCMVSTVEKQRDVGLPKLWKLVQVTFRHHASVPLAFGGSTTL